MNECVDDSCAQEGLPLEMPLVYYHGDTSPGNNPDLYKFLVERWGLCELNSFDPWISKVSGFKYS